MTKSGSKAHKPVAFQPNRSGLIALVTELMPLFSLFESFLKVEDEDKETKSLVARRNRFVGSAREANDQSATTVTEFRSVVAFGATLLGELRHYLCHWASPGVAEPRFTAMMADLCDGSKAIWSEHESRIGDVMAFYTAKREGNYLERIQACIYVEQAFDKAFDELEKYEERLEAEQARREEEGRKKHLRSLLTNIAA